MDPGNPARPRWQRPHCQISRGFPLKTSTPAPEQSATHGVFVPRSRTAPSSMKSNALRNNCRISKAWSMQTKVFSRLTWRHISNAICRRCWMSAISPFFRTFSFCLPREWGGFSARRSSADHLRWRTQPLGRESQPFRGLAQQRQNPMLAHGMISSPCTSPTRARAIAINLEIGYYCRHGQGYVFRRHL